MVGRTGLTTSIAYALRAGHPSSRFASVKIIGEAIYDSLTLRLEQVLILSRCRWFHFAKMVGRTGLIRPLASPYGLAWRPVGLRFATARTSSHPV